MEKKKTAVNGLRRIISAVLTFVMIFTLIPAAFAEEDDIASASGIALTAPTPERIFCAVNNVTIDIYGVLGTEPVLEYLIIEGTEGVKLSQLVNEDGTFTDYTKSLFDEILKAIEDEFGDEIDISSITIPDDIYGLINTVVEALYEAVKEFPDIDMTEIEFFKAFPTADALVTYIADNYFGGNKKPPVEDIINFAVGNLVSIDAEGYIRYVYNEDIYDDMENYIWLDEIIAPSGAYLKPFEQFGSYRNVYAQLKDKWDAGEISNEDAFEILTGYAADPYGDLYTVSPVVEYLLDKDGSRVHINNIDKLLNDDLTIGDTGLSARDYAIQLLAKEYESYSHIADVDSDLYDFLVEYVYSDQIDEDYEAIATELVDSYIENLKDSGADEADIALFIASIFIDNTDPFGYIVKNSTVGYAKNSAGEKVNINDIMDEDGKFLTDEFGAESVTALFEEYLKDMSTEAILKGDVNDDGRMNLSDVSLVLKKIAGWNVEVDDTVGDVNGDGVVNVSDASLMLKSIADWDVSFVY